MRITLDTNQFLRALMRPPELATFVMAWQARRFTIVCSAELLAEYQLVLEYPQIMVLVRKMAFRGNGKRFLTF